MNYLKDFLPVLTEGDSSFLILGFWSFW